MTNKAEVIAALDRLIAEVTTKAAPDDPWAVIRSDYRARIAEAMTGYLATDKPSTSFRGAFRTAAIENLPAAFWNGYAESAGEVDYSDSDAGDWMAAKLESELGFIGELFVSLKQLRDQFWRGEVDSDGLRDEVKTRVDGYAATLESVRVAGKMWGSKNQMLEWELGNTEQHCESKNGRFGCANLDGTAHRAKWYLARDLIPRKPGASQVCGGWQCDCKLKNVKTGEYITL